MWKDRTRRVWQLVLITGVVCAWVPWGLWAEEESGRPPGMGLAVEPGGLLIQYVKPGKMYDLAREAGISLKVSNRDAEPRTYRLSSHQPSAVGAGKWLEGYEEIPDPSWFWFEEDELTVPGDRGGRMKMYFKIPEGERYDNQHWVVAVGVRGRAAPGEMLALAVYPRYQIETASNAEVGVPPAGALGIAPSMLEFEDTPLGERVGVEVTVYNNESASHRYSASVRTIPVDPGREQIVPSPGYAWLPDVDWVSVRKRRFKIKANGSRTVNVKVNVPDRPAHYGGRWEALLWMAPDEGRPRFARIRIETAESVPGA